MNQLHPIAPGEQVQYRFIVAQCEGAYLAVSRAQYTLVVGEPGITRHWSRRTVNFEMALERANKALAKIRSTQ
jgi:hypothetical protein